MYVIADRSLPRNRTRTSDRRRPAVSLASITGKGRKLLEPKPQLVICSIGKMRVRGVLAHMTSFSFQLRTWRNWVIQSIIAAIFIALSFASFSQDVDKPKEVSSAAVGRSGTMIGAQVFRARCISCHNKQPVDNSPFGPPNLFGEFKRKAITHSQAEMIIVNGKGGMPGFGNVLSKGDIRSVIEYLNKGK